MNVMRKSKVALERICFGLRHKQPSFTGLRFFDSVSMLFDVFRYFSMFFDEAADADREYGNMPTYHDPVHFEENVQFSRIILREILEKRSVIHQDFREV